MHIISKIVTLAIFASLTGAENFTRCGTSNPSEKLKSLHAALAVHDPADRLPGASYVVNTYVHVITDPSFPITSAVIQRQINVLNQAYSGSGFSFVLAGTPTQTTNSAWTNIVIGSAAELAMKRALHQGTYKDLNIYFARPVNPDDGSTLLGFATFPQASPTANDRVLDGLVANWNSVAGPPGVAPYNLGYTAVHEIGHWLGLLHTFGQPNGANGCGSPGDYIADTPSEFSAAYGCQNGRDTCTGGGPDPIHNYMDYSDDPCMNNFTPGQFQRAQSIYASLRAGK